MEKNNGGDAICQAVFLLSAIVRRIRDSRVDKDSNQRLNRNAPEKRAEPRATAAGKRLATETT